MSSRGGGGGNFVIRLTPVQGTRVYPPHINGSANEATGKVVVR